LKPDNTDYEKLLEDAVFYLWRKGASERYIADKLEIGVIRVNEIVTKKLQETEDQKNKKRSEIFIEWKKGTQYSVILSKYDLFESELFEIVNELLQERIKFEKLEF